MSFQSEQASSLEAIKKQEIPGMNTAVYAASMDHCKFLDEFGRKNYILGVEAGAAHAQKETDAQVASAVEQSEDVIAALTARNDELEGQDNPVSNTALVIHARDRLDSAKNQLIELASAQGIPSGVSTKIRALATKLTTVRDECTTAMDSFGRSSPNPTKRRRNEPQGRRDGPVKRERRQVD